MAKINKYLLSCITAMREQLTQKSLLIGKILVYSVVVYVFAQIFDLTPDTAERIWYISCTQLLVFSMPSFATKIEDDIHNGIYDYFLFRPCNYLLIRLFESFGTFILRFLLLLPCFCVLVYLFTGYIPLNLAGTVQLLFICSIAFLIYSMIQIIIGLLAFWINDISPILYLNQTTMFFFGGLIIPINFYQQAWQKISFLTPYPWILWWPATHISERNTITLNFTNIKLFTYIVLWQLILTLVIFFILKIANKKMLTEGTI